MKIMRYFLISIWAVFLGGMLWAKPAAVKSTKSVARPTASATPTPSPVEECLIDDTSTTAQSKMAGGQASCGALNAALKTAWEKQNKVCGDYQKLAGNLQEVFGVSACKLWNTCRQVSNAVAQCNGVANIAHPGDSCNDKPGSEGVCGQFNTCLSNCLQGSLLTNPGGIGSQPPRLVCMYTNKCGFMSGEQSFCLGLNVSCRFTGDLKECDAGWGETARNACNEAINEVQKAIEDLMKAQCKPCKDYKPLEKILCAEEELKTCNVSPSPTPPR